MRNATSRSRVRGGRSPANLLLVVPAFAVIAGLSLGALWLIWQMQSWRCPAGTFLAASGRMATILQVVSILLASIGYGFLAANGFARLLPPLRTFFDRDARRHGQPGYRRSQRALAKLSLTVAAIMLPIGLVSALSQYCLQRQEIWYQPWPWGGLRHYSWQDVARVETSCRRGARGSWNGSFLLILTDGARFDIMAWPGAMIRAYPEIAHALAGVGFAFSAKGVSPRCGLPYVDLLERRP